jgi:hypothetical protein
VLRPSIFRCRKRRKGEKTLSPFHILHKSGREGEEEDCEEEKEEEEDLE